MSDSSKSLSNEIKCQNSDRLQSMFDKANKVIFIKEMLIGKLNAKIIEHGSKVKEGEALIQELKN
jgi:hypothetical protein